MSELIRLTDFSLMIFGIMIFIGLPYMFIKNDWRKIFGFLLLMGMGGFTGTLIVFFAYVFFG